jgi:hypothetical protein
MLKTPRFFGLNLKNKIAKKNPHIAMRVFGMTKLTTNY